MENTTDLQQTGRSTLISVPSSSSTLHSRCPFFTTAAESTWSAAPALRIPRPVRRRLRNRISLDIASPTVSGLLLFSAVLTKTNVHQRPLTNFMVQITHTPQTRTGPINYLRTLIQRTCRNLANHIASG